MGLDRHQLQIAFRDPELLSTFSQLFGLRQLLLFSILPTGYEAPPELAATIQLSDDGEQVLAKAPSFGGTDGDLKLALFGIFAYDSLLIDLDRTDLSALTGVLSDQIRSGQIRFPYLFGRTLYDRYFDSYPTNPRDLPHEQTWDLLQATGQGVFQLGEWLTGPFGLLRADATRLVPPANSVPLTHCSNPGCDELHPVNFRTGETGLGRLFSDMQHWLQQNITGTRSEWAALWHWSVLGDREWSNFNAGDLFAFLPNALVLDELRVLLARLLRSKAYKGALPVRLDTTPEAAVSALSQAEVLQLVLLFSDETICETLDMLTRDGSISLGDGEFRKSVFSFRGLGGYWNQRAELSRFGVRFTGRQDLATLRLRKLILKLADNEDTRQDLEWRLMDQSGTTLEGKILQAVQQGPVEELLSEVILSRQQGFVELARYIHFGTLPTPLDNASRKFLLKCALWKLGFEAPSESTVLTELWKWHRDLSSTLNDLPVLTSNDQAAIRSIAVNFFVALEEILETSLAFTAWALLVDHWSLPATKRFVFNPHDALMFATHLLDGSPLSDGSHLVFSPSGGNNLFGVVAGYSFLARHLAALQPDEFTRPLASIPDWARHDTCREFPFGHSVPWFDIENSSQARIIASLESLVSEIGAGDVLRVRNRVPHQGREFPAAEDWEAALAASRIVVTLLESGGFMPFLYSVHRSERDSHGRQAQVFQDYAGREVVIRTPSPIRNLGLPGLSVPQVIFKSAVVRHTMEPLRFRLEPPSAFSALWSGYPRRRGLPPPEEGLRLAALRGPEDPDE